MQDKTVGAYYNSLSTKTVEIKIKRIFDILLSFLLIVLLSPLMAIISISIRLDSRGSIVFKQIRITQYLEPFIIYKFRTMYSGRMGAEVTSASDSRITKVGKVLRKTRMDEIPQLFNILKGDMSFVGVRPEVPTFVVHYSKEMLATFLLPAGLTSNASIEFKEEQVLIKGDYEKEYIEKVLPVKMRLNLEYINNFSLLNDFVIMLRTFALAVKSIGGAG